MVDARSPVEKGPGRFGIFDLEMARFGAVSVVF